MDQKRYQSTANDLLLGRYGFILDFKEPWPLKFEKKTNWPKGKS
jgi:hypothetical protein